MSSWPDGFYGSDVDPPEAVPALADFPPGPVAGHGRTTKGSLFLYVAVLIVVGVAVGALTGRIDPILGAVIVLGSEVVGTIAFFLTYYIGRRE